MKPYYWTSLILALFATAMAAGVLAAIPVFAAGLIADIFIGGLAPDFSLAAMLKDQPARPTDLKGLRWRPAGSDLAYDLCLLPDFLGIAAYRLEPTMANLLASIDFTINAILFDVDRQTIAEQGCTAAVRERVIDFNSRRIPDKGLIAYRALLMAHKTGFHLAAPVFDFLRNRLEVGVLRQVKGYLQAKLGKAGLLPAPGGTTLRGAHSRPFTGSVHVV